MDVLISRVGIIPLMVVNSRDGYILQGVCTVNRARLMTNHPSYRGTSVHPWLRYTEINGEETTRTPGRIRVEPPPVRLRN